MNSSIDTLLKISASAAKPAPTGPARDDASQFDNYLRQAAKTTTAPEPAAKPQPTARPAKEESNAIATGEQDAAASSDDEAVPTQVAEQAGVSPEESTDAVEGDEILISAAAAAIVAQQLETVPVVEILTGELAAEPSAESPSTETNMENSAPAPTESQPENAAPTDYSELLPTKTMAAEENGVAEQPLVAPTEQSVTLEQSEPTPAKASAEGTPLTAATITEKRRNDRGESEPSEQNSQKSAVVEIPIEIPQPAVAELVELVTDADKSTYEKPSSASSSTSTPHFSNQTTSQTVGAPSGNAESHVARGEGESPTPTIDRARFVQRVTNAFRAAQQNDGHIQLRLSPPELGQLRIEIAVRNGVLSANLETETADARRVLLDNLPALRQRLAEQDIRIDKFEVDIRREGGQPDGQAGAQERQAEQQSQRASAQNRIRTTPTSEVITTRVPRTQATSADASLDVRI